MPYLSEKDTVILLNLYHSALKIQRYSQDHFHWESFSEDEESYDAAMMNFVVIGECAGKLSDPFKDALQNINWRKMYNYRNIIAHDYFGIDTEIAWEIITKDIPNLIIEIETVFDENKINH